MSFGAVLLLDSSMLPVKTISWERAMVLYLQNKANLLEDQGEIAGSAWHYRVPFVLQLKGYIVKKWDKHVKFNRQNLFARDDFTCQYCLVSMSAKKLTIEHIFPRSRGGGTTWENVVAACIPCNQKKEGRTPEEAGMKLGKKPTEPHSSILSKFQYLDEIPDVWQPFLIWLPKRSRRAA